MTARQSGLSVRVQPRSRQDTIEVSQDGVVRVRVRAAPERGKANQAVIRLLAKRLGVPISSVSIAKGRTGRLKTIRIEGMDASEAVKLLKGVP